VVKFKLICFDVDGTLVDNIVYSWQIFHNHFKTDPLQRERAMKDFFSGRISYQEWALHDIMMWKEKNATKRGFFEAMNESEITLMHGALETIKELKKRGYKLAIISGSINVIMEHLLPDYEDYFDDIFFSRIFFDSQGYIEKIEATEYDMEGKALALKKIAEREKIPLSECAFIGDHQNDREVAAEAGFSIAFDAKDDELRKICDCCIDTKDLRDILKYF